MSYRRVGRSQRGREGTITGCIFALHISISLEGRGYGFKGETKFTALFVEGGKDFRRKGR